MTATTIASNTAWHMGLLPLAWLGARHRIMPRSGAWWLLAIAFGVSWLADLAAHWVSPDLVGNFYPVTQSAIVGLVLLDRGGATVFVVGLMAVAFAALALRGVEGADVILRSTAWGITSIVVVAHTRLGRLRMTLLVYFGLGLVCWLAYAAAPGWWTWGAYQLCRLAGLSLFCWASLSTKPFLRIAR